MDFGKIGSETFSEFPGGEKYTGKSENVFNLFKIKMCFVHYDNSCPCLNVFSMHRVNLSAAVNNHTLLSGGE